jgi:ribonuclease M5
MERLSIPYPVIVEGKYDRAKLSSVIDARIITTDGFGIFKNEEKRALIRALARKTPLIVLTDPDGAGGVIRSHICSIVPPEALIRLYVPRVRGVEKRKSAPSAEGVLGVEGIDPKRLYEIFLPYSANGAPPSKENPLSPAMLCRDGFTGAQGSAERRDKACRLLELPEGMNAKAFLSALRFMLTYEEYLALAERLSDE